VDNKEIHAQLADQEVQTVFASIGFERREPTKDDGRLHCSIKNEARKDGFYSWINAFKRKNTIAKMEFNELELVRHLRYFAKKDRPEKNHVRFYAN